MTREEVVAALRRALDGRSDVRLALLFGSRARGKERPDSDVDVAVDAPGVDTLRLMAELSSALHCEVDVVSLEQPSVVMLHQLVRDGIVVHEGRRGAAARWLSHALTTLETDLPMVERMSRAWLRRVATKGFARG